MPRPDQTPVVGVGFRHAHFPHFDSGPPPRVDFFEAITENFMHTRGRPFKFLEKLRADYPFALHGVSMSIAGPSEPDKTYLSKIKELMDIVDPFVVSDHLCWTGGSAHNLHNLLPVPFTEEVLGVIASRVSQVQNFLGRRLHLENLSAYFTLNSSTYSEAQFLNELCKRTGCGILLDVNNIYVNSVNQGFDARAYLEEIDLANAGQIHLAGHSDMGDFLFDTHSEPVPAPVWELYRLVLKKRPDLPALIEWDENIPDFPRMEEEVARAKGSIA